MRHAIPAPLRALLLHTIQDVQLLRNTARQYRQLLEALRDEKLPHDDLKRATYLTDLLEVLS